MPWPGLGASGAPAVFRVGAHARHEQVPGIAGSIPDGIQHDLAKLGSGPGQRFRDGFCHVVVTRSAAERQIEAMGQSLPSGEGHARCRVVPQLTVGKIILLRLADRMIAAVVQQEDLDWQAQARDGLQLL